MSVIGATLSWCIVVFFLLLSWYNRKVVWCRARYVASDSSDNKPVECWTSPASRSSTDAHRSEAEHNACSHGYQQWQVCCYAIHRGIHTGRIPPNGYFFRVSRGLRSQTGICKLLECWFF